MSKAHLKAVQAGAGKKAKVQWVVFYNFERVGILKPNTSRMIRNTRSTPE
jgi:hypothetical protein